MTQRSTFICPTLCGCVLTLIRTWRVSEDKKAAIRKAVKNPQPVIDALERDGAYDEVGTTYEIVDQCADHKAFATPFDLWEELKHFHGNNHSPDTCGCTLNYWFDDRVPQDDRVHVPVDHPVHTKRCEHHADHEDVQEHHDAVLAENVHKNIVAGQIAEDLNLTVTDDHGNVRLAPEKVLFWHDDQRVLSVHVPDVEPTVVEAVVAKAEALFADHPLTTKNEPLASRVSAKFKSVVVLKVAPEKTDE